MCARHWALLHQRHMCCHNATFNGAPIRLANGAAKKKEINKTGNVMKLEHFPDTRVTCWVVWTALPVACASPADRLAASSLTINAKTLTVGVLAVQFYCCFCFVIKLKYIDTYIYFHKLVMSAPSSRFSLLNAYTASTMSFPAVVTPTFCCYCCCFLLLLFHFEIWILMLS